MRLRLGRGDDLTRLWLEAQLLLLVAEAAAAAAAADDEEAEDDHDGE